MAKDEVEISCVYALLIYLSACLARGIDSGALRSAGIRFSIKSSRPSSRMDVV